MTYHYKYKLDDHGEPVSCEDLMEWAQWFEHSQRSVARTPVGGFVVSTVFLSLNHSFGSGPPILWETMVFESDSGDSVPAVETSDKASIFNEIQDRCSGSREQALAMHERMVERVKQKLKGQTDEC